MGRDRKKASYLMRDRKQATYLRRDRKQATYLRRDRKATYLRRDRKKALYLRRDRQEGNPLEKRQEGSLHGQRLTWGETGKQGRNRPAQQWEPPQGWSLRLTAPEQQPGTGGPQQCQQWPLQLPRSAASCPLWKAQCSAVVGLPGIRQHELPVITAECNKMAARCEFAVTSALCPAVVSTPSVRPWHKMKSSWKVV